MVATEAAGEGINLQFCHLMINYDLPWNPTRLEQRMGRIHRYGQKYEVYIYNLVATTTREGMVFHALLDKLERMREGLGQDRVFDVVDQLLEGVPLERLIRDALANRLTFEEVRDQVLARLDRDQEQRLQEATLAGLATRYVDLSRLRADRQRAAEARLVPAYIRAFFLQAMEALAPGRVERRDDGFWRIPYVPAALRDVPEHTAPAPRRPRPRATQPSPSTRPTWTPIATWSSWARAILCSRLSCTMSWPALAPIWPRGRCCATRQASVEGLFWLLVGSVEDGLGRIAGRRLFALFQPLDEDQWSSLARLLARELPVSSPRSLSSKVSIPQPGTAMVLSPAFMAPSWASTSTPGEIPLNTTMANSEATSTMRPVASCDIGLGGARAHHGQDRPHLEQAQIPEDPDHPVPSRQLQRALRILGVRCFQLADGHGVLQPRFPASRWAAAQRAAARAASLGDLGFGAPVRLSTLKP